MERLRTLFRKGAIARLLESRTPDAAAEPVLLPDWAAELGRTARGVQFRRVDPPASGVRLIGDVQSLAEPVPLGSETDPRTPTTIGLDLAVESMAGMLSAALGREPELCPDRRHRSSRDRSATRDARDLRHSSQPTSLAC